MPALPSSESGLDLNENKCCIKLMGILNKNEHTFEKIAMLLTWTSIPRLPSDLSRTTSWMTPTSWFDFALNMEKVCLHVQYIVQQLFMNKKTTTKTTSRQETRVVKYFDYQQIFYTSLKKWYRSSLLYIDSIKSISTIYMIKNNNIWFKQSNSTYFVLPGLEVLTKFLLTRTVFKGPSIVCWTAVSKSLSLEESLASSAARSVQ